MRIGGDGRESACVLCVFWLETRLMTVKHTHSHTHSHTHTHTHTHTLEALRIARRIRHAHILAVKAHHLRVARRLHGHAVVLARGQVKPEKKKNPPCTSSTTSARQGMEQTQRTRTYTHTRTRMHACAPVKVVVRITKEKLVLDNCKSAIHRRECLRRVAKAVARNATKDATQKQIMSKCNIK